MTLHEVTDGPVLLDPPDRGALFVVSGPSGVGKSTLIDALMRRVPGIAFSVSATTRAPRTGEVDGVHYHFLTPESFEAEIAADAFLEHADVYGRRYGTLVAPTQDVLARGGSLLLDIDVQGAAQVRARMPDAVHIFLLPPDRATLEQRLRARSTDEEPVIQRRLAEMDQQLAALGDYDYLVVNDHLPTAAATFVGIVLAEMSRRTRREQLVRAWRA
jgi:guanylate kinase